MVKSKKRNHKLRETFLQHTTYFQGDEIKKYAQMSNEVLRLMSELETTEPSLAKEHDEVLKVLLNNYDQQIENISSQVNIIDKFLSCIEILEEKPDDQESLKVMVQYKKSLGLI